ncbi:MAG: hypothetical protein KDC26_06060 [Armatimonadetes bacterium]|nr:hypothetical protein [Armatimonadota bacterium]
MLTTLLIAPLALVTAPIQDESVELKFQSKVGDSQIYQMTSVTPMDMGGQSMEITFSARLTSKVLEVTEETYTVEATTDNMTLKIGDQPMPMGGGGGAPDVPEKTVVKRQFDAKTGLWVKDLTENLAMGSSPRIEQLSAFAYPGKAIKVGGEWFHDFPANKKEEIPVAKAKFTIVGSEMVGKWDCWKISHVYSEMEGNIPFGAIGTIWLDKKDHSMVKYVGEYQNVKFVDMMPPANSKVTLTRI